MEHTDLANRMKEYYENIPKTKLMRRTPVAIRLDGKCFHSFTTGFEKPFDEVLHNAMNLTMKYLCENIQNCVFGYSQSDEITLILVDYDTLKTDAWFNYEVQKLCSVSASMATFAFNKFFKEEVDKFIIETQDAKDPQRNLDYLRAVKKGATFDSRCFNIPKEEVCNLIYWRQYDATNNSIQMVGQCYFFKQELKGKSKNDIQDMLLTKRDINWNDFPTKFKRGSACKRDANKNWYIDDEMPILKGADRKYVEDTIYFDDE